MVDDRRAKKRGAWRVALGELAKAERDKALEDRGVQLALMPSTDEQQPATIAPGRGRPPGAQARAPREFAAYLVEMGGDVVLRAVRIANADTLQLATALECTPLEAAHLQRAYAQLAAPFQHQELPKPIEIEAEQWAGFVMMMGAASRSGAVDPAAEAKAIDVVAALSGPSPRSEDLQDVTVTPPAVSDAPLSDDEAKSQ